MTTNESLAHRQSAVIGMSWVRGAYSFKRLLGCPRTKSQLIVPGADSVLKRTPLNLIKLTEARDSRRKDALSAGSKRRIHCPEFWPDLRDRKEQVTDVEI